jgi:predicted AAA+ superfamily ATPase
MKSTYITRIQEKSLSLWLMGSRRKPLVIRGARQTGKSTLIRTFAKNSDRKLIEINLEDHRSSLRPAMETGHFEEALAALVRIAGWDFRKDPGSHFLFLDEVQTIPSCLQLLRYFYEQLPDLAVVAAGSVLEFTLNDKEFSMPVGRVEYLHVAPLTFKEFLDAKGLHDLKRSLEVASPWTPYAPTMDQHTRLLTALREFFLIGGLPESVLASREKGLLEATAIQRNIIASYRDDLQKYPTTAHIRSIVRDVFDRSPIQIAKKTKYSSLSPGHTSRDVRKALQLLLDAGVLLATTHSHGNGIPLGAESDPDVRKLFYLDVGLLCCAFGLAARDIPSPETTAFVNEGVLAEQFIAQELSASEPGIRKPLYYWLREGKADNAEVDFLWAFGKNIVPLEVKAGASGRLRSLNEICRSKSFSYAIRFDTNLPSLTTIQLTSELTYHLLSLPLYLASEVNRIVEEYLKMPINFHSQK